MYKHLSREQRYQIHSLMRANHTLTQIARLLGRHRSTISREIRRGHGGRGYRAEQACDKAKQRSQGSRNAKRIQVWVWPEVAFYLGLDWSPEQIANTLPISHETVYQRVYADKVQGGQLHRGLRSQKPRRKRHLCGRDRRGQIRDRTPSVNAPLTFRGANRWGIGRGTLSLVRGTVKRW